MLGNFLFDCLLLLFLCTLFLTLFVATAAAFVFFFFCDEARSFDEAPRRRFGGDVVLGGLRLSCDERCASCFESFSVFFKLLC